LIVHLIAGLGNPGRWYSQTRHNVGFMLVDRLASRAGIGFSRFGSATLLGKGTFAGRSVLLIKPQTYMNLSGESVREVVDYFNVAIPDCLVVFDDIALPLGKIRFRSRGSSGGHKGMQSIIDHLRTQEISRLRIGIGRSEEAVGGKLRDFVLGRFARAEESVLQETLSRCEEAAEVFLAEGIDRVMARYN